MFKILIVAPSIRKVGGAEKTAWMLANELEANSFKVTVLTTVKSNNDYIFENGIEHISLKSKNNIARAIEISKIAKEKSFDLIIGYTIIGGILGCLSSKFHSIKVIVCERQDPKAFSRRIRFIRDFLYKKTDGAVFQTNDAKKYFSKICKDSIVIPNFLDVPCLPMPIPFDKKDNIIAVVGRLEKVKNHDLIIRSFALSNLRKKGWKMEIFGEGRLKNDLQILISELGLENQVILCGYKKDVLDLINTDKVFVLFSDYEGYPNALLEALSLGIFCIAYDCPCGGPKDMLNEENGYLVETFSNEALLNAFNGCDDISKMRNCANNGLLVRKTNNKDYIISKWVDYITKIINK